MTAKPENAPTPSKQQLDEVLKRREELLERIKNVDVAKLKELTLALGEKLSEADQAVAAEESFHQYFFRGHGGFTEAWRNGAMLAETLPSE